MFFATAGSALYGLISPLTRFAQAQAPSLGVSKTAEDWMGEWMGQFRPSSEQGILQLSRFVEPMYFLLPPISWSPNHAQAGYKEFTVPKGFVSDLASIPPIFFTLLRPDGEYAYAAILHDYLYWEQTHPKEKADDILKFAMEDFGVKALTVETIYKAVHLFGQNSWDDNARARRGGEKRVLKQFPDDPRIRWKDWKTSPAHFGDL